jgi:hypothetical protein
MQRSVLRRSPWALAAVYCPASRRTHFISSLASVFGKFFNKNGFSGREFARLDLTQDKQATDTKKKFLLAFFTPVCSTHEKNNFSREGVKKKCRKW